MKITFRYFLIELRRSLKMLGRTWANLLLMLLLLVSFILVTGQAFYSGNPFSKINVAIATQETDELTEMLLRFIASMDSVKSVCDFQEMNPDDALEALRAGKVRAVVSLPENFYEDVDSGVNTPATVYFPKSANLAGTLFRELLKDGVSMLQTAEAGVYATYDYAKDEDALLVPYGEVGNVLAKAYFAAVMDRTIIFDSEIVSAFGRLSGADFYLITAILAALLMCGPGFGFLFDKRSVGMMKRLRQSGAGSVLLSLEKCLTITLGMLLLTVPVIIYKSLWNQVFTLLLLTFSMATYIFFVYELIGDDSFGGIVLLVVNIGQLFVSGCFIPAVYLPFSVRTFGSFLPTSAWFRLLQDVIMRNQSVDLVWTYGYGILFFLLGFLLLRKRLVR